MRTTGPVVFLDSLLMAHSWQRAEGLFWLWCGSQHDLGTINHMRTTGPVVFLDSLLIWRIHGSMLKALALV